MHHWNDVSWLVGVVCSAVPMLACFVSFQCNCLQFLHLYFLNIWEQNWSYMLDEIPRSWAKRWKYIYGWIYYWHLLTILSLYYLCVKTNMTGWKITHFQGLYIFIHGGFSSQSCARFPGGEITKPLVSSPVNHGPGATSYPPNRTPHHQFPLIRP